MPRYSDWTSDAEFDNGRFQELAEFFLGSTAKFLFNENRRDYEVLMNAIETFLETMKRVYAENDYPSDRLINDREALNAFATEFNARVGERYSEQEVADELHRIRKDKVHTGGLPRVGRSFHGPRFLKKPR